MACRWRYSCARSPRVLSGIVPLLHNRGVEVVMQYALMVFAPGLRRLFALLVALLLTGAALAQSDVYRSRDASGRAVFSDRPGPGESRAPSAPNQPSPSAPASVSGGSGTDWQAAERSFRQRNAARAETEQREAKARQQQCEQAQARAQRLKHAEGVPAYYRDKSGAAVFVSDQERAALVERNQLDVERNCRR